MSGNAALQKALDADGIAKQALHVILLVDTSRSMAGARIGQVNAAIADIGTHLMNLEAENANVNFYVSVITFSDGAECIEGYRGVRVGDMEPLTLTTGGYSNLHLAYETLAPMLEKASRGGMMPDFGGVAPIILLMTDGHPTKSVTKARKALEERPWFRAALRYGIAIGQDDERTEQVLTDFAGDPDCVVGCPDAAALARMIRVIVLTASRVKSQSNNVRVAPQATRDPHAAVKQQIRLTLDEIDTWEW